MALIELDNAGYKYPGSEKWVFRHFSMTVDPGEAIRMTGRNGAGKSTLLKVLCGLLQLTEGELRRQSGSKLAYMDQFSGEMLARDLTIAEQFEAAALPGRSGHSSIDASIELLGQFGLGLQNRLRAFVGHLSGGERQIVALLCTLAAGANILCLDEFASALDERSKRVAEGILRHVRAVNNITLILVSHIVSPAQQIDRELAISAQA